MLLVCLGICIALLITAIVVGKRSDDEEVGWACAIVGSVALIASIGLFIAVCALTHDVRTESVIDKKIAMYEEENSRIEQTIDRLVQNYEGYESTVFADTHSSTSTIAYATLFPELKSNELVQKQMEVYFDNNAKIKELRTEKINLGVDKWLLYFGK